MTTPTLPSPLVRRQLRELAGDSLERAGQVIGVTKYAISRWEHEGEPSGRAPQGVNALRYAEYLEAITQRLAP